MRYLTAAALAALAACGPPQRIGLNVLSACTQPEVDTTTWRRIPGPFPGYTVLAPATLSRTGTDGADVLWGDASRSLRVFRRPWGAAQFQDPAASRANYTSCWTRIAEMRSYIVVRRVDGGYQVTGWYRRTRALPDSAGAMDGVISGAGAAAEDQAVFLRMVRSLAPDTAAQKREAAR